MKCFLFVNLLLIFGSFSPRALWLEKGQPGDCFNSAVPKFTSDLYTASIDVVGHHISGLLFLKSMPDSSQRAVFTSETGITFFDFEWNRNGDFKTYHVIKRLRKKIVLNTLRKDFELIVVPASIRKTAKVDTESGVYSLVRKKEQLKFRIDSQCQSIIAVEVIGKKGKLIDGKFFSSDKNIPDSVSIVHHNFNMKIGLKRIVR